MSVFATCGIDDGFGVEYDNFQVTFNYGGISL